MPIWAAKTYADPIGEQISAQSARWTHSALA